MKLIESEILLRQEVATKYITQVENKSILPSTRKDLLSAWAQFTYGR